MKNQRQLLFVRAHGVAELVEAVFRETFERGAHIHVFIGAEIACLNPDAQVRLVSAFEKATDWRRKEKEAERLARDFWRIILPLLGKIFDGLNEAWQSPKKKKAGRRR
jgi:hypothetical protein